MNESTRYTLDDSPWDAVPLPAMIVLTVLLLVYAVPAFAEPWQVRADGPETFAVFLPNHAVPSWALKPGDPDWRPAERERDFCQGLADKRDAEWLRDALNKRKP